MTVKDLIEELQKCPEDYVIVLPYYCYGEGSVTYERDTIRPVVVDEKYHVVKIDC